MKDQGKNIYPVFDQILKRSDKEQLLKQRSKVVWMTGLSGAGKTTIAKYLDEALYKKGYLAQILDGDNIRSGINSNLAFSEDDRYENIRRIAEVSKLFINCGIIIINSFISPTEEIRKMALEIIGQENFIEVFIDAPIEVCEQRDTKGLYARARKGEIKNFTGINSPFEFPSGADITINTDKQGIEESVNELLDYILPKIQL
ncbi:MAG: adenylyl-sulfate kinase [Bacteroidales bacterium]|nr:adenylyl-sulfate kinase [Bacteroidales bacterium]MCF8405403.1 adenylyl-sulfate kinase [Bacteroidales bacterium]